jgi:hypothetical protein
MRIHWVLFVAEQRFLKMASSDYYSRELHMTFLRTDWETLTLSFYNTTMHNSSQAHERVQTAEWLNTRRTIK